MKLVFMLCLGHDLLRALPLVSSRPFAPEVGSTGAEFAKRVSAGSKAVHFGRDVKGRGQNDLGLPVRENF